VPRKVRVSDGKIAESLRKHRGNKSLVAEELGYSYRQLNARVKKSPRLTAAATEARDIGLDIAEEVVQLGLRVEQCQMRNVLKLMESRPELAATLEKPTSRDSWNFLRTQGKHRGYTERNEVTGKDGESLSLVIKTPKQSESPEAWMAQFGKNDEGDDQTVH
jgi:hypothetical protein